MDKIADFLTIFLVSIPPSLLQQLSICRSNIIYYMEFSWMKHGWPIWTYSHNAANWHLACRYVRKIVIATALSTAADDAIAIALAAVPLATSRSEQVPDLQQRTFVCYHPWPYAGMIAGRNCERTASAARMQAPGPLSSSASQVSYICTHWWVHPGVVHPCVHQCVLGLGFILMCALIYTGMQLCAFHAIVSQAAQWQTGSSRWLHYVRMIMIQN